jgi:hypothetical protein
VFHTMQTQAQRKVATGQLYLGGGLGLLLAAFLLFPGNPVWDLSRARVPNTILVYLSLIPLMLAVYRDRERYLTWFATRRPWMRCLITLTAPLGLAGFLNALGWLAPLYIRSLAREWGLIEPFTFGLYWCAVWCTVSWARLREAQGQEVKPYYMLAVLCGLGVLEECDYLGIFGGIIGRIDGVYVGALHDLFGLWYRTGHNPWWGGVAVACGLAVAYWLWRQGYCSATFLRREFWSVTSLPVMCGVILLMLAQMADIDTKIFGRWIVLWCDVCEETLEFFFAVLLMTSLGLKYARDYRPGAPTI